MTKAELLTQLEDFADDEEITARDFRWLLREREEARQERLEELEERQHASGFYAFQDLMDMYRRER